MRLISSALVVLMFFVSSLAFAQTSSGEQFQSVYDKTYEQIEKDLLVQTNEFLALKTKFDGQIKSKVELDAALSELMRSADGSLLNRNQSQSWMARQASGYIGVGLSIDELHQIGTKGLLIDEVVSESTAEDAGIKVGDRIIAVDGIDLLGELPSNARELIQGRDGSIVKLKIDRAGSVLLIDVVRDLDEKIGISMELDKPKVVFKISWIYPNSPAKEAGLVEGDILVKIDGTPSDNLTESTAIKLMKKTHVGDPVTVTVLRDGVPTALTLKTGIVPSWDLSMSFEGQSGDGYNDLYYTNFTMGLRNLDYKDLVKQFFIFHDYNKHYPGGVIDMRGASGDDVGIAVQLIAGLLDKDGEILRLKQRVDGREVVSIYKLNSGKIEKEIVGQGTETVFSSFTPMQYDGKLAILVDSNTSGVAEAVVHALQREDRAIVVGSATKSRSQISTRHLTSDGSILSYVTGNLMAPDGSLMNSVTPDKSIMVGADPIDSAKLALAGKSWHELPGNMALLIAGGIFALIFAGLVFVIFKLKPSQNEEDETIEEASQPVIEDAGETEKSSSSFDRWIAILAIVAVIGLVPLVGWIAKQSSGPPSGSYTQITVELYTDGSEETNSQKRVFDELASQYSGSIEFQVIDTRTDPDATDKYGFGELDSFPRIVVSKRLFDENGKQISLSRSGRGKTPKRELVPMIERAAESHSDWPEVTIKRTKNP